MQESSGHVTIGISVHQCWAYELTRHAFSMFERQWQQHQSCVSVHTVRQSFGKTMGMHGCRPCTIGASKIQHSVTVVVDQYTAVNAIYVIDAGQHIDLLFSLQPAFGSDACSRSLCKQRGISSVFSAFAQAQFTAERRTIASRFFGARVHILLPFAAQSMEKVSINVTWTLDT